MLYIFHILFLSFFFNSCSPKEVSVNQNLKVLKVEGGRIAGTLNDDGDVQIYKGIPFAAPPIGELRWKAPQPVIPWNEVRESTEFGPSPMQQKPAPFSMWSSEFLIPEKPISEDCLYLNVWTGAKSAKDKLPVLVWIYGGGFLSGGSAVPIYDGEALAKKGIVLVSFNYRVGIFGFFAHPELTKESENNTSGNYGLMDQLAALHWVKNNIAAFGGDPDNVTIAGQSAGSMSVNALVASPLAKGLFKKAIAQSGANFTRGNVKFNEAEKEGEKIANSLNSNSISEMRNLPAEVLLNANQSLRGPIIDGYVLPKSVKEIFDAGNQNKVTLLTGWNEDEGILFGPVKSAEAFKEQAEKDYGVNAAKFLKFYPASSDKEAAQSQLYLSRDLIFGLQNYAWSNYHSKNEKLPVYTYRFQRIVPAIGEYKKYGAFHTGEVPYVFDNLKFVDRPWEEVDHKLADIMSQFWVNFISSGDPNGKSLPSWPAYTLKEKKIMVFDAKPAAKRIHDDAALDFLYYLMSRK